MDELVIEGNWWIHGRDKAAQFGTFTSDARNGLSLVVKIPQSISSDEVVQQSLGIESAGNVRQGRSNGVSFRISLVLLAADPTEIARL
jgi:hypothetical protein